MIEDPKLTREILEYFAQDNVGFPADKTIEDLKEAFPGDEPSRLEYHVVCALENGLLMGEFSQTKTYSRVFFTVGFISGLTSKGGDYVRESRSKFWKDAWKKIQDQGIEVTTTRMLEVLPKIISAALNSQ